MFWFLIQSWLGTLFVTLVQEFGVSLFTIYVFFVFQSQLGPYTVHWGLFQAALIMQGHVTSQIYNNIILHVVVSFMFLNCEDAQGEVYELVHNTIYNFTGNSPVKFYCKGTVDEATQPPVMARVQNNIFSEGSNTEIYDAYGFKKFYGNTDGITGLDCLD